MVKVLLHGLREANVEYLIVALITTLGYEHFATHGTLDRARTDVDDRIGNAMGRS